MADTHTPLKRLAIKVDRDGWSKGLQLSIDLSNDKGGGVGYRLAGPKFNGSSSPVFTHFLTERDASEIRSYLDAVFPRAPSQDAETIKALRDECDDLRGKLMVLQHSDDANAHCAELTRKWSKEIVNTNCAFVDDDLRILAHLANRAVKANLTDELPETVRAALAGSAS